MAIVSAAVSVSPLSAKGLSRHWTLCGCCCLNDTPAGMTAAHGDLPCSHDDLLCGKMSGSGVLAAIAVSLEQGSSLDLS